MQVRKQRRRRNGSEPLPALPAVEEGQFRDIKTGVLLLPSERVETSPGRRSVVRRFLVSCLGDADAIFARLYAQLRELGWVGAHTVVVIVGDGAQWIWNRASMFVRRCEILDFWHAGCILENRVDKPILPVANAGSGGAKSQERSSRLRF